ncbi:hypothetical protein BDB00DRAFT_790018 [Zychaea mexicana]|uniref:uncharacterized protein n=1 Tax=Zychaea mexicana TaxID=64656 RepID=UPI0022FE1D0F|nr:uncharacterized protein BDB00DRAFT_790018 [Zychaea mexicana]KAI9490773.1 hypothetical protein BDB00DRAFT_790018 [Zychaea mexicana]
MTYIHPCSWSLLDNDTFNVLYLSRTLPDDIRSTVMGRSLFNFMHPDEVDLAQMDLKRFVTARTLSGSVTRCRLRNLVGYAPSSDASAAAGAGAAMSDADWLVVDVILYAATDQLLLAFFHVDPDVQFGASSCFSCSRHSSRDVSPYGTLAVADHIIIPYGCITFAMTRRSSVPAAQAIPAHIAVQQGQQQRLVPVPHSVDDNAGSNIKEISNNRLPSLHDLPHLAEESFFGPHQTQQVHIGPNTARPETSSLPEASSSPSTSSVFTGKRLRHDDSFSSLGLPPIVDVATKPFIPYARRNVSASSATALSTRVVAQQQQQQQQQKQHVPHTTVQSQQHYPQAPSSATMQLPPTTSSLTTSHAHVRNKRRHSSSAKAHQASTTNKFHPSNASASSSPIAHSNRCESCGTDSSPEWRKGPSGHKTLCNACGLRYSRSVAPSSSTTSYIKPFNDIPPQYQHQQHHHHHHNRYDPILRCSQ